MVSNMPGLNESFIENKCCSFASKGVTKHVWFDGNLRSNTVLANTSVI